MTTSANTPADFTALRRAVMERAFSRMNDRQREAVFHTQGPLLILAGAGSGKTTVLINRIANLVMFGRAYEEVAAPAALSEEQWALLSACAAGEAPLDDRVVSLCAVDPCPAYRILAITFTNKAAGELKERLIRQLGPEGEEVMASTFHSFCARILRREGERLGYSSHFTIYDTDDSRRLMKDCLKSLNIDEKILPVKSALAEISRAKDSLRSPADYAAEAGADFRLKKLAAVYELYQRRLLEADAMDFDDLLSRTVELLRTCPDVRERYQRRYRYILVDEYQDTNHAQYQLISLLAAGHGNLCVVGDDDQSIYQFRGATIENILSFEEEFPNCRVIRLEQNYRSTGNILDAANAVIAQNEKRKGKTLWTENPRGDKIQHFTFENEDEEARFIADTVLDGVAAGAKLRDFVVLYRANAQSNAIERALVKAGGPYRIIGGHRFFDTQEVRDAMAYLRVIHNPADAVALTRILNQPKRGIGDTMIARAAGIANELGITLYKVLSHADEYPALSRSAGKLKGFTDMIDGLRALSEDGETSLPELYNRMLSDTGYLQMWELAGEAEAGRVENLKELESSLKSYEQEMEGETPTLAGFLEEAALMTDVDNYNAAADTVVLMTMHAAKGLEFPTVFLPGFEEGVFPGMQTWYEPEKVEEERRLCYVAITRAKKRLYLTNARSRMLYGTTGHNRESRFLQDIPEELVESTDLSMPRRRFADGGWQGGESGSGGRAFGGRRERGNQWGVDDRTSRGGHWEHAGVPGRAAARAGSGSGGASGRPGAGSGFGSGPIARSFLERQRASAAPDASAPAPQSWKEGDRVSHRTFGEGTITALSPMGNDTLLTIRFDGVGVKKLMANFARLQRL